MKEFEVPEVEVVVFDKKDIITASDCGCVSCIPCPEKDHCSYDFGF